MCHALSAGDRKETSLVRCIQNLIHTKRSMGRPLIFESKSPPEESYEFLRLCLGVAHSSKSGSGFQKTVAEVHGLERCCSWRLAGSSHDRNTL